MLVHGPHAAPRQEARHLAQHGRGDRARHRSGAVVIDHNNEETVQEVLDRGFWAAFTIYPNTKMGNERMVEIARRYGSERIFIDSSADWGVSDPLAVPKTARLDARARHRRGDVEAICYGNALAAYGQSGQMQGSDWLDPPRDRPAHAVSRAIPCCAARRPRVDEPGPARQDADVGGVQVTSNLSRTGSCHERRTGPAWRRDQPGHAVYHQGFAVRYDYPVHFTEHLFARDNPVFLQALMRREPGKRHRFVVFVDANVAASWPTWRIDIARVRAGARGSAGTASRAPKSSPAASRSRTIRSS